MPPSVLFASSPIDVPDGMEQALASKHGAYFAGAKCTYTEMVQAYLYAVLTAPEAEREAVFQSFHPLVTDSWAAFTNLIKYFTFSKYDQLLPSVRSALMWLVRHLLAISAFGIDGVLIGWIKSGMPVDAIRDSVPLISSSAAPAACLLFIQSDPQAALELLKSDAFDVICRELGRELVFALQGSSENVIFRPVWKRLLRKIDGRPFVERLLQDCPPQKRYAGALLSPKLESSLLFLAETVPMGNRHRYLEWLAPAVQECPLQAIRFLVVAYHPSNSQLASANVQRWTLILWILQLTNCDDACMLAVIFDWLFYRPGADSIMLIEAAILTMHHCIPRDLVSVTERLLRFLDATCTEFYPPLAKSMRRSLRLGMREAIDKKVIPSLDLFLQALSSDGQAIVRRLFLIEDEPEEAVMSGPVEPAAAPLQSAALDRIRLLTDIPVGEETASQMLDEYRSSAEFDFASLAALINSDRTDECWKRALERIAPRDGRFWRRIRVGLLTGTVSELPLQPDSPNEDFLETKLLYNRLHAIEGDAQLEAFARSLAD